MKRIFLLVLFMTASCSAALGQTTPTSNQSERRLIDALKAAGNFNTLISFIEIADFRDLDIKDKKQVTLLAPNDDAFAKLPPGTLDKLKTNPAAIRGLLRGHTVSGKVMIQDMLVPVKDEPSKTYKEVKNIRGDVVSIQCSGAHAGEHHPFINQGAARIGRGDIGFAGGVIQEIDTVLIKDR